MRRFKRDQRAQALIEIAFLLPMLTVLVLGTVDYSRATYDEEVITNLAGEGSSLASRSGGATTASLSNAVTAVLADTDIDLADLGCVVVSAVTSPSSGSYQLTGQVYSSTCNIGSSYVGCYPTSSKCASTAATLPAGVQSVLTANSGQVVYVTEVFYKFNSATAVGKLVTSVLPSQLYAVAYY